MRVQSLGSFETKPKNNDICDRQVKIQKWLNQNQERLQAEAGSQCTRCAY